MHSQQMFNECIARHRVCATSQRTAEPIKASAMLCICSGKSHLPAADSEKESQDIGLFLLLKFCTIVSAISFDNRREIQTLNVLERTHVCGNDGAELNELALRSLNCKFTLRCQI